jgi:Zn-dependent protease
MNLEFLLIYLAIILMASVAHEFMHGFVAYLLGDDTAKVHGRLSFNPLKHIDPFLSILLPMIIVVSNMITGTMMPIFGGAKPVPFNPSKLKFGEWGSALVAIAGPLTNLLLAFIFTGLFAAFAGSSDFWADILRICVMVNLGFFAFNILPIPPLDGSRVLYVIAPEFLRRLMEKIEQYGLILVFVVIILFSNQIGSIIGNVMNFFLNIFVVIFQ